MFSTPERQEIDHHTIKLIVGLIAISLATLTSAFSDDAIESISASYHVGGWARDVFVGFLFAISAFLLAYNGMSQRQMILSKVAAFAAMGIAMVPCKCEYHPQIIPYVHGISAGVMFFVLAGFCYSFYRRARDKGHTQAIVRSFIYAGCGITIVGAIVVLGADYFSNGAISSRIDRLTFYGEYAGLVAFGIAWLIASRALPVISRSDERLSVFS